MEADKKTDVKCTKKGEGNIGKHYERRFFALISVQCLLNPEIDDFWVASNLNKIDKFDDVILHVQFKTGDKEIFLIQAKSRNNGDKCLIADMFLHTKKTNKDLSLTMYQDAYYSMVGSDGKLKDEVMKLLQIDATTKVFFVLVNNCKMTTIHGNLEVELKPIHNDQFRHFITTRKYEDSTGFTLDVKSGNFDSEFLNRFYFYPEQLEFEEIKNQIQHILSGDSIVDEILQYFYQYSDSATSNLKLTKADLKLRLLSSLYGTFLPPNVTVKEFDSNFIRTIKQFDVTVITEDKSESIIWRGILSSMQRFYNEELDFENWETRLSNEVQTKIAEKIGQEHLTVKKLYLFMVANSLLPFYKKTDNRSSDINIYSLLSSLKIYSVIYNTEKNTQENHISFPNNITVLQTMNDMSEETFEENLSRIFISFRNKQKHPLKSFLTDADIGKYISADQFIQLCSSTVSIGYSVMNEDELYIRRTLKRSFINEDVLEEGDHLYIVCNAPSVGEIEFKNFGQVTNKGNFQIFVKKMYICPYFLTEDYEEMANVMVTTSPYSLDLLKEVRTLSNGRTFYLLQCEDGSDGTINLNLLYASDKIDHLRPFLNDAPIRDSELLKKFQFSNINIICNNAGMGKSMLLRYLLRTFPAEQWVVYLELSKHVPAINKIQSFKDLVSFLYKNELTGTLASDSSSFQQTLEYFFELCVKAGKVVLLIDDFEEIHGKPLLDIFKQVAERGVKLWIVARPYLKTEYENLFGVFSLELTEFTKENQDHFFRTFFKKREINSKAILRQKLASIKEIINNLDNPFIGICQQTMMLAEIFKFDPNSQLRSTSVLYDRYLNVIIEKYYGEHCDFVFKTLSKIALTNFFTEKMLKKIFDWNEFECDVKFFGKETSKNPLIAFKKDYLLPLFSHKTYAEFLAARWLSDIAKRQVSNETPLNVKGLTTLLYCQELTNVRWFFDAILAISIENETNSLDIIGRNIHHYSMTYGKVFDLYTSLNAKEAIVNREERAELIKSEDQILIKVTQGQNENEHFDFNRIFNFGRNLATSHSLFQPDRFLNLSAFDCAILAGNLEAIEEKLKKPEVYNVVNFSSALTTERYFMLYHAVKYGFGNILRKLVDNQQMVEELVLVKESTTKMSLLHLAIKHRKEDCVKELLNLHRVHEYGTDEDGNTAMHLAVKWKNSEILKLLLDSSEKISFINTKNNKGQSHLFCFTQANNLEAVKMITKYEGIDIDAAETETGNSPFITSILYKNTDISTILHKRGANINLDNNRGMTALHFAVIKGSSEKYIKQLLEWKADINCKNEHGLTPLIFSAIVGKPNLVKLLLTEGANIKSYDQHKWTALHHAVKRNQLDIVNILLESKCSINFKNKFGYTPLMLACLKNYPAIVETLLNNNANIQILSNRGSKRGRRTALQICQQEGHKNCQDKIEMAKKNRELVNTFKKLGSKVTSRKKKQKSTLSLNWIKVKKKRKRTTGFKREVQHRES